ncbi:CATRA conflict system CASPASE/TPR repeat-associated protein [Cryptosporangium sp. NPDC051539]|uniref:CATRA conflict system CASPASE/TPR repeat-associated protein n=1 Tax=Cryptosporangium sp. NPDC051539 TaxID=3363962 RepID=UPI0037A5132E
MTAVVDQQLVIHAFAPLAGPDAAVGYDEIRQVWRRCRDLLGVTEPVVLPSGDPVPVRLPPADRLTAGNGLVCAQQRPDALHQAVVRIVDDWVNLSIVLAADEGAAGWDDLGRMWSLVSPVPNAPLVVARAFQGVVPDDALAQWPPAVRQVVEAQLPKVRGWQGGPIASGLALWQPLEPENVWDLVVLGVASPPLLAWTWVEERDPELPPLGRRLLRAIAEGSTTLVAPEPPEKPARRPRDPRKVLVICGPDDRVRARVHDWLRMLDLRPVEREECVNHLGEAPPSEIDVLLAGLELAQAALIVLTPESVTWKNGTLEAVDAGARAIGDPMTLRIGLALGALSYRRTLIVEAGSPIVPPGLELRRPIRLDDTELSKRTMAGRLALARCDVRLTGSEWLDPGMFHDF